MHNDELESILIGKTITTVKFTAGMSGHCNFIKEIHLDDGTIVVLIGLFVVIFWQIVIGK